jgi:hypothetical protein
MAIARRRGCGKGAPKKKYPISRAARDRYNRNQRERNRLAKERGDMSNWQFRRTMTRKVTSAADKKRRKEEKDRVRRVVKISDEDKRNAYLEARPLYENSIQCVMDKNPGRQLLASITLHGNSIGKNKYYTPKQEAIHGSLSGHSPAIVVVTESGDKKYWRNLTGQEIRQLSDIPPQKMYEYSGSDIKGLIPDLAEHVEFCLQLDVAHRVENQNDRRVLLLQRVPGLGGAQGEAPFSVNLRITVLNENGTIPIEGAVFWRDVPYGTPHVRTLTSNVGKVKKPKKISAPRVSESPQLEVLVDTDEDGDSKPARKFRRLSFGVSVDKDESDDESVEIVLLKSNGESGDDESDDESVEVVLAKSKDESDDENVEVVLTKSKDESDDESVDVVYLGDDESDDESIEVVYLGDDKSGEDKSSDESEVESAEGDNTSDYDPDEDD